MFLRLPPVQIKDDTTFSRRPRLRNGRNSFRLLYSSPDETNIASPVPFVAPATSYRACSTRPVSAAITSRPSRLTQITLKSDDLAFAQLNPSLHTKLLGVCQLSHLLNLSVHIQRRHSTAPPLIAIIITALPFDTRRPRRRAKKLPSTFMLV